MVGVLMLLLMAGLAIVQMAAFSAGGSRAACGWIRDRMTAASGAEYAGARLIEDARPRWTETAVSRGDDWTERQGPGIRDQGSGNPSYGHGEPWINAPLPPNGKDDDGDGLTDETGEGNGTYEPGETFVDLDGDGRFSAWSGRLRGGQGAFMERFSLAVGGRGGWIPVNAGFILHPLNPALVRDWATVPYHRGLAHVLNNLGALLLPPTGTGRLSLPTGWNQKGHLFQLSRLGFDLVEARPDGGYRSLREVREALLARKYLPEEIDRILPFLDLGPYDALADGGRCGYAESREFPAYVPIGLRTAPREVLESLWRYLVFAVQEGHLLSDTVSVDAMGRRTSAWRVARSSRTGDTADTTAIPFASCGTAAMSLGNAALMFGHIYPDEAALLASLLIRSRQQGDLSWASFHQLLADAAPALFLRDALDLAGDADSDGRPDDPPRYPLALRAWTQAKADLAFQAVAVDPRAEPVPSDIPWFRIEPLPFSLTSWASWGVDRDPKVEGVQPSATVGFAQVHCLAHPPKDGTIWPNILYPYCNTGVLAGLYQSVFSPQGGTLALPTRFQVRCEAEGGRASAEGAFETAERLELTSQEDFEGLAGGAFSALSARGISLFDPGPAGRFDVRDEPRLDLATGTMLAPAPRQPHVVSLPRRDRRSRVPSADLGLSSPLYGFSRTYGGLTLAPRETGLQGAKLGWPLSQAGDGDPSSDYVCEADPAYDPVYGSLPTLNAGDCDVADPAFANAPSLGLKAAPTLLNMIAQPNPVLVTGHTTPFEMPAAIENGVELKEFSIECWLGRESEVSLYSWMPAGSAGPEAPGDLGTLLPLRPRQLARITLTASPFKATTRFMSTIQSWDRSGSLFHLLVEWSSVGGLVNGANAIRTAGPAAWLDLAGEPGLQGKSTWHVEDVRFDPADPAAWARWKGSEPAWQHHVVLTFERRPVPGCTVTIVRLHVNGSRLDTSGNVMAAQLGSPDMDLTDSMPGTSMGQLYRGEKEWLLIRNAGPVRLYDRRLSEAEVADRYAQERFVRDGLFRSPTYILDEPGRFIAAQATAIAPPGLWEMDPATDPVADPTSPHPARCRPKLDGGSPPKALPLAALPVQVYLNGYQTVPGEPGHPKLAAGFPAPVDPTAGTVPLSALNLGEVRSFDYLVAFNVTKAAGVQRDPPVFESLWLSLRRKSRSGIWSRWDLR